MTEDNKKLNKKAAANAPQPITNKGQKGTYWIRSTGALREGKKPTASGVLKIVLDIKSAFLSLGFFVLWVEVYTPLVGYVKEIYDRPEASIFRRSSPHDLLGKSRAAQVSGRFEFTEHKNCRSRRRAHSGPPLRQARERGSGWRLTLDARKRGRRHCQSGVGSR